MLLIDFECFFVKFPSHWIIYKFTHREIKYQDVGCVSHFLVQYYNKNNKKIANKANNDDEREDYGDDDGHHGHQDLQVFLIHITHVGQDTLVGHCVIHD